MKVFTNSRVLRTLSPSRLPGRLMIAAALTGMLIVACGKDTTAPAAPVASIVVTPSASLAANATQQFVAVGKDANGNVVAITPVWSVVAGGGTISSTGMFTAGAVGGTFINSVQATSGGISGTVTVTVTVTVGPLATITVTPGPASMLANATQQFTAVGKDAGGNVVAMTPVWSVVSGGGAINSTGLFTAGAVAGTFANTVQASNGSISGTATVTVTLSVAPLATITVTPGSVSLLTSAAQQVTAVGKDASGNIVAMTPVWSVVAGGGTISSTGLFTAGTVAGTFASTVQASSGSISATATVTVTVSVAALVTITVTPGLATVPVNGQQQFSAVGRDAGGNIVAMAPPVWLVSGIGGTISSTGLFTADAQAGTFTIRASSGTSSGTASVTVTATVVSTSHGPAAVNLGSAANYVILAKSGISNVPTSAITGDLGLSPAAASFITGFALTLPAGGAASTSAQVTGNVYASDYAVPTPNNLTVAVLDMQTAYTDAAGRPTPDHTELATGAIGGLTLAPGLYKWSNTVTIGSNVTLSGSATDVWIFQIAGGLTEASATAVILDGGAVAANVFWQVAGIADIGTTAHMEGQIMSQTSITLHTGATANGRLMAQTAVTLAGNTVVKK